MFTLFTCLCLIQLLIANPIATHELANIDANHQGKLRFEHECNYDRF